MDARGGGALSGVVLITGGSRGIGAATALLAARHGYAVAINYRAEAERAEALVQEIRGAGGQAVALRADVSQQDEAKRLFTKSTSASALWRHWSTAPGSMAARRPGPWTSSRQRSSAC